MNTSRTVYILYLFGTPVQYVSIMYHVMYRVITHTEGFNH